MRRNGEKRVRHGVTQSNTEDHRDFFLVTGLR